MVLNTAQVSWEPKGTPRKPPPPRNKAVIFGLIKGNQWVFIVPDHKAGYFLGVNVALGGSGPLGSHDLKLSKFLTLVSNTPETSWGTLCAARSDWFSCATVERPVFFVHRGGVFCFTGSGPGFDEKRLQVNSIVQDSGLKKLSSIFPAALKHLSNKNAWIFHCLTATPKRGW